MIYIIWIIKQFTTFRANFTPKNRFPCLREWHNNVIYFPFLTHWTSLKTELSRKSIHIVEFKIYLSFPLLSAQWPSLDSCAQPSSIYCISKLSLKHKNLKCPERETRWSLATIIHGILMQNNIILVLHSNGSCLKFNRAEWQIIILFGTGGIVSLQKFTEEERKNV